MLRAVAEREFPELLREDGSLALEFVSYERSWDGSGSFTEFRVEAESELKRRTHDAGFRFRFPRVGVHGGCHFAPGRHTVTMELYVNGHGAIPSHDKGYEIAPKA